MTDTLTIDGTLDATHTYTVYPTHDYNRPPPPSIIPLHGLDVINPGIQIRSHRFYHPQSQQTDSDAISTFMDKITQLKHSLAKALELYPPVAGTVRANDEGQPSIFVGAGNDLGTALLVQRKSTPYTGDTEEVSPRLEPVLSPGSPIFMVKVTQFSCGTIAVAASMSHQVTDLRGFLDFLEVWAQLARGEPIDFNKIPENWSHNPGRFFSAPTKGSKSATPPGFVVLPAPPTEGAPSWSAPSKLTRWKFDKSSMERLKQDLSLSLVSPSTSSKEHWKPGQWISSGDALASLFWGVITRARENGKVPRLEGRSSLESEVETLVMAADGRDRSPQGTMANGQYFGNFNTLICATVSRSDLLSPSCEAAARVALEIRNALNRQLSPEALAEKLSFFEAPENARPPGRINLAADVILTNWCRFNLGGAKSDFGWGKPFLATPGASDAYPPGYGILLSDDKSSGDVFAMIGMEQGGEDELNADVLLNKYATPSPS